MSRHELLRSFRRDEFRVETMRGTGPGGQKRNKTESCVRITHVPSGIHAYNCDTKSQHQNKRVAFTELADRLIAYYYPEQQAQRGEAATFGHAIRSYKEGGEGVKDECGATAPFSEVVYGDGLEKLLIARARARAEE